MTHTVAIVGAGPAGLMLACELRTAGVDTVVFERLPAPCATSPGAALNPALVELLNQRGMMGALREDGMEIPLAWFANFQLDPTKLPGERPFNFLIAQSQFERRLEERAVALGAELRRGTEVIGLDQDDDGVLLRVRADDGEHNVSCRYLVGCDGAASTVRELAGIGFPGTDHPFYGLVGDLDSTDELLQHLGVHLHPGGIFAVYPIGPSTVRVMTCGLGVDPPDKHAEVTADELRAQIRHIAGVAPAIDKAHWLSRWFHMTRQADRYRHGRVFLAGDAAHVHFPLGGQSLNTGIEDVMNLGWKLAATVHGRASADLLDTYHTERHPVAARVCSTTQAQLALMHPLDKVAPLRELFADLLTLDQVNEYLVQRAGGLDVCYPAEPGASVHPLVGQRLADIPLETPEGDTSVAATLHAGRGVVLDLSGGMLGPGDISGWADRVDVVMAEPSARIGAMAVLLRPDGRIAWATAATDDEGLCNALERWFGPPRRETA